MAEKFMYIPNNDYDTQNYPFSVDYNEWLKHLDTELNKTTNQNSPKLLSQRNLKHWVLV